MPRIYLRKPKPGEPQDLNYHLDYFDEHRVRQRPRTEFTSPKKAALRLAEILTRVQRLKMGLEIAPSEKLPSVDAAWQLYLAERCPEGSLGIERSWYNGTVRGTAFSRLPLSRVDSVAINAWLESLRVPRQVATAKGKLRTTRPLKAVSLNGRRNMLAIIFNWLVEKKLFVGVSPVPSSRIYEEAPANVRIVDASEVERIVAELPEDWRDTTRVAFYTGLRRGEIYALRKDTSVINFEALTLTPKASNERNRTKGMRGRKAVLVSVPILPEAVEPLRRAWEAAQFGELLFPEPEEKKMRTRHFRPTDYLRTAMGRAGIVEGWLHRCVFKGGCRAEVKAADEQPRRCPSCARLMRVDPVVPSGVKFHGLRHSFVTQHLRDGVHPAMVQKLARHKDLSTTQGYAHLVTEDMRAAVEENRGDLEGELFRLERRLSAKVDRSEISQHFAKLRQLLAQNSHKTSEVDFSADSKKAKK